MFFTCFHLFFTPLHLFLQRFKVDSPSPSAAKRGFPPARRFVSRDREPCFLFAQEFLPKEASKGPTAVRKEVLEPPVEPPMPSERPAKASEEVKGFDSGTQRPLQPSEPAQEAETAPGLTALQFKPFGSRLESPPKE